MGIADSSSRRSERLSVVNRIDHGSLIWRLHGMPTIVNSRSFFDQCHGVDTDCHYSVSLKGNFNISIIDSLKMFSLTNESWYEAATDSQQRS